jgi:carbamoyltransferase
MHPGVLGIWDGHGAGVAIVARGALRFALSEERPSRRKRHSGFPHRSLALATAWAQAQGIALEHLALAGARGRSPLRLLEPLYAGSSPHREPLGSTSLAAMAWENRVPGMPLLGRLEPLPARALLLRRLGAAWGPRPRLHSVDHHDAHAYGALLGPGRERALVLTADAYGEGLAATLRRGSEPERTLAHVHPDLGLALLYGAVTVALGFAEGDEGKVMGLAATGSPQPGLDRFLALFAPGLVPRLRRPLTRRGVARLVRGLAREDAAAALQACVEQRAVAWVRSLLATHPAPRLHLAGGLFANVRLNQLLAEIPGLEGLFVFPAMGDEGLAAGAAHAVWHRLHGEQAQPIEHASLGVERSPDAMLAAIRASGLPHRAVDPVDAAVARLEAGDVICRYAGRDEYGPRALGDSSILFRADRPALAARVNRALGRDPIMAFAPIIPAEAAPGAIRTPLPPCDLAWMTITTTATTALAERCPVAVHVDGTARPQLVAAGRDPQLHALLSAWVERSGQPALINTSFNLHGEPIVHSPADALRSFEASGLDALLMGGWEVRGRSV